MSPHGPLMLISRQKRQALASGLGMSSPTFEAIFRSHFAAVERRLTLLGLPQRDVEDVAQDVFVALYRAMERGAFDASLPVWPWLRTTSRRIARDYMVALTRQGQPTDFVGSEREPMDDSMDAERSTALREEWTLVRDLLKGLPYERRLVLILHEIEQLTLAEIAADLEISPNTVATRLRLARADVEEALRRQRAKERRTLRGAGALLPLPLGVDALLRRARDLPGPAQPSDAEERVWARVQHTLGSSARPQIDGRDLPVPRCPRTAGPLRPSTADPLRPSEGASPTWLVFLTGVLTGALVPAAVRPPPPPPPREPVPIMAAAPAAGSYVPASRPPVLVPAILASATASATPAASSSRCEPATPTDTVEAEKHCLEAARARLASDPAAALRDLAQCEQRFPRGLFPDVRDQIRQEAREALAQGRAL
jgi:RNA polymerase sigma-70 factor, ECF subfamily